MKKRRFTSKFNFILHPSSFILSLLLTACLATITPPPPRLLKIAGSTSMGPLLTDLAAAYSAQHPHVTFDIQGGGSHLGQTMVESGQVDLGLISWAAADLPPNLRAIPLARDAVALITHPQNRPAGLAQLEVQAIFSGRLLNWQEVAGQANPIQVISREDGSGTRMAFEALVMDNLPVTPMAIVLPNSQAVVDFVAQNPNAIAYVSLAFVNERVSALPLEGVAPTLDSLADGSYPLTRDLSLLVPRQGQPELDNFVSFALSPAGQTIIAAKWGLVR